MLYSTWGYTQADSFIRLAQVAVNDSMGISYYHEAAQRMHTDSALVILHHSLRNSISIDHLYWQAKLYQTIAKKCSQLHGDIDSLFIYSEQSYQLFETLNIPIEKGRSLMQMGMGKMNMGDRELAMQYLTAAAQIFENENATSILAPVYINISSILNQSEDHDSEFIYLSKAFHIARKADDSRNEAIASMGLQSYFNSRDQLDSATTYANRAFEIATISQDPVLLRYSTMNLGELELTKGNHEKAEHYYLKLLDGQVEGHDRARMLYYVACFYQDIKDVVKADSYFKQASDLASSIQANDLLLNIQYAWTRVLFSLGKYEQSAQIAQQYIVRSDSLHSVEVRNNLSELTIKYETEKKERENQELIAVNNAKKLEIVKLNGKIKQQVFIILLAVFGLLATILFYYLNRKNQRQKEEIARQQSQLQEQKIKDLETDQILTSIKALVRGQEEERSRIAKELHDGLGSIMSSLKLSLSQLPEYSERLDYQKLINNTLGLSDKANNELRRIAQNLMPESLTRFGLIAALEDFIAEINFSKVIHIQFQYFYTEQELPDELGLSIYRIIQELLNNTIKHAKANEVFVQLMKHGDMINITVEDDGIGFDTNKQSSGNGFGNIKSRLAYFGGQIRVESKRGEGSSIFIECPIHNEIKAANDLSK